MFIPQALRIFTCSVSQVKTFKPQLVAVRNESLVDELKEALADADYKPEIIPGEQGVIEVSYPSFHYLFSLLIKVGCITW